MKKLTRFIAGFSAAAALLLGVGCTNQADYVEDNTARNACNIEGLYVEGLDKAYDGNVFELHAVVVNEKGEAKSITEASDGKVTDDTVAILTGTVADSYTKDSKTVGHKSGTIYKTSADNKRLFDGDSMAVAYQRSQIAAGKTGTDIKTFAAGTLEFYLKVGNDYVFGTKKNSAGNIVPLTQKLSIPTSPAGTSDAALQSRWVKVVIANGVPTATLEKKVDEPVNVTLANIKLNLAGITDKADLPKGVTLETSDKTTTVAGVQKFTIKITGLKDNAGTKVILDGARIGEKEDACTVAYDHNASKGLKTFVQTISDDGEVSFTFYGKDVEWTNRTTNFGVGAGPEITISDYKNGEGDQNSNPRLLENSVSATGGTGDFNFVFPKCAIGDYDVTLTIDRNGDDVKGKVTQADPVVSASEIKINAIYVANLTPDSTKNYYLTAGADDSDGRKFVDTTEMNGSLKAVLNKWNASEAGEFVKGATGLGYTFSEIITVRPGQSNFILAFRSVVKKDTGTDFDWDAKDSAQKEYTRKFATPLLLTESYANGKAYTLYADNKTGFITLVETENVDFSEFPVKVKTLTVTGWTKDWTPNAIGGFNNWGADVALTAVTGKTGEYTADMSSTDGIFPGTQFKFRKTGDWDNTVGGYIGNDSNIAWPLVVSAKQINVICEIDNDGKVKNPVKWEYVTE